MPVTCVGRSCSPSKWPNCLNLKDKARAGGIEVDLENLAARLGVPMVATVAVEHVRRPVCPPAPGRRYRALGSSWAILPWNRKRWTQPSTPRLLLSVENRNPLRTAFTQQALEALRRADLRDPYGRALQELALSLLTRTA